MPTMVRVDAQADLHWLHSQPCVRMPHTGHFKTRQPTLCMLCSCECAQLTKMVLAGMRERKRGLIINVGSIIANHDAPLVAGEKVERVRIGGPADRRPGCNGMLAARALSIPEL